MKLNEKLLNDIREKDITLEIEDIETRLRETEDELLDLDNMETEEIYYNCCKYKTLIEQMKQLEEAKEKMVSAQAATDKVATQLKPINGGKN